MPDSDHELTRLLRAARDGGEEARERLYDGVYGQLHDLARREFRAESAGHTLQPTALVSEAFMRLAGNADEFGGRAHFFGAAARAMRRILVEHARANRAQKRGAGAAHETFVDFGTEGQAEVVELDDALEVLGRQDPRLVETVQLRWFAGLKIDEIANCLGVSTATVKRDLTYARAWLIAQMSHDSGPST